MEQKFQRGFRVEILTRQYECPGEWENTGVGEEAIIEHSDGDRKERADVDSSYRRDEPCYRILICHKDGSFRSIHWFEERFLELICWNVEKGEAILKKWKERGLDR